jgi:hypothetical protein
LIGVVGLTDVRYAPVATKFRTAVKWRDVHKLRHRPNAVTKEKPPEGGSSNW